MMYISQHPSVINNVSMIGRKHMVIFSHPVISPKLTSCAIKSVIFKKKCGREKNSNFVSDFFMECSKCLDLRIYNLE